MRHRNEEIGRRETGRGPEKTQEVTVRDRGTKKPRDSERGRARDGDKETESGRVRDRERQRARSIWGDS